MKKIFGSILLAMLAFSNAKAVTPPEIGIHNHTTDPCGGELMVVLYAISTSTGNVVGYTYPWPMSSWAPFGSMHWDHSDIISSGPGWDWDPGSTSPSSPAWFFEGAFVYSSCNATPGGTGPACAIGSPVNYDALFLNSNIAGTAVQECLEINAMPCMSCNPGYTISITLGTGGGSNLDFNY